MKRWIKIALCISLSFMCMFTCVGYASVNGSLFISATTEVSPPNAVFIIGIPKVETSGNATVKTAPTNIGYPSTKVMSEIVFANSSSSVTFNVEIKNGTAFDQYFNTLQRYTSMEGVEGSFSYGSVKESVSIPKGTKLAAGEKMTFTVTLSYNGWSSNQTRKMLYEFDFVLNSNDLTQAVSKGITEKFADILNNGLEKDITYTYNGNTVTVKKDSTYQTILNNMQGDDSGNYIGNLKGANADDKALLTALFEGELTFTVGNEEVPVTVMIKNKPVNNSSDSKMVLYITADDLSDRSTYVPVFVVIFSQNASGEWEQVGEILEGEAYTKSYSGWPGSGSFDTEMWRSTKVYNSVPIESSLDAVVAGFTTQTS